MVNVESGNQAPEFALRKVVTGFGVAAIVIMAGSALLAWYGHPADPSPLEDWAAKNDPNFDTTTK